MSQFRDTFTRGSKKDSVLSYDDFASRIFTSGFLICFLVPLTVWAVRSWFFRRGVTLPKRFRLEEAHSERSGKRSVTCGCSLCQRRLKDERPKRLRLSEFLRPARFAQLLLLALFWWLVVYLIAGINPDENIKKFDPFELLGLSTEATKKDVQKAYRHLSLKYHPDRNPNDPEMSAHFVLITKAYRTLTNETSRMNYAKYGNPDGPGMMKIGIGLPRFLVDENNQIVILSLFFLVLLIVVPSLFIWYYRTQKNLTATGVRVETLQLIYYSLNENTRHKALPEIYSCCTELTAVPYHASEEAEIKKYVFVAGDYKRKNVSAETFRNFLLLVCHLNRVEDLTPGLAKSLREILKYSMLITQCMLDVAVCKGWLLTFRSVVDFRRGILQGLEGRNMAFYQLPHFSQEEVGHATRGKNTSKHIEDYVRGSAEARRGLNNLPEDKKRDVEEFCRYYPDVALEVKVYVDDEEEIYQGDLVTVEIVLRRNNLKEGELVGPIHAPHFPFFKYEQYYFLVTYPTALNDIARDSAGNLVHVPSAKNRVNHTEEIGEKEEQRGKDWESNLFLNFASSTSREREIVEKVQVLAEKSGVNTLCVTAINDSYFGAEFSVLKKFYVLPTNLDRAADNFKIHPEDLKLDEDLNPISKMIGELLTMETSEEEEVEHLD